MLAIPGNIAAAVAMENKAEKGSLVTRVDEEVFVRGEVIMEHGNRVDELYFVCHGVLASSCTEAQQMLKAAPRLSKCANVVDIGHLGSKGARNALSVAGTMLGYYLVRVLPSKTTIGTVNPTFFPRVRNFFIFDHFVMNAFKLELVKMADDCMHRHANALFLLLL
ncbi:hypothetical protein ACH5RR_027636 [Cinchona calisaya]|uniref:Cyclic nucleotide-binding domain-containing protein n=1 Tax=Cinchona calisaya TaxID=153742 RepID=A0ABD2Z612_9GENT